MFFIIAIISILSGLLLGGYYTFIVPISAMVISDLILGNTWILLFTWSGFVFIAFIGYLLKSKHNLSLKKLPTFIFGGICGVLIYDLWTNFGTWLGGWYSHSLEGLILCYTMAVPFMIWHLLSTTLVLAMVLIPLTFIKEFKNINLRIDIKPFERYLTIAAPAVLMILAIVTIFI